MPAFKSDWNQLVEYASETYPGVSMASNAAGLVSHIVHEDQTEDEFAAMMTDLRTRFPGGFEVPPAPLPPPTRSEATKRCPECGEVVLMVAKKCKHCHSPIA